MKRSPIPWLILTALFSCGNLLAALQRAEPCSAASVPVAVVVPDGRIVRGLKPADFRVELDGEPQASKIVMDSSARRILFLMDLGKHISSEAWKAEVAAASHLVQKGRAQDRFALMTFDGPAEVLGFDTPRSTLEEKLGSFAQARPEPPEGPVRLRDALVEALKAFRGAQYGDAVVLLFGSEDTGSHVNFGQLQEALRAAPVRIFGVSFGTFQGPAYWIGAPTGPQPVMVTEPTKYIDFSDFISSTGGAIYMGHSGNPQRSYELTEENLRELRTGVWRIYGQIVETYRIELPAAPRLDPKNLSVTLSADVEKKLPGLVARYPSTVAPCHVPPS